MDARQDRAPADETLDLIEAAWLSLALSGGMYVPPLEALTRRTTPDQDADDSFALIGMAVTLLLLALLLVLAAAVN